jgi:hypothetical protein
LVTIIELKSRGDSGDDAMHKLSVVKNDVTSASGKIRRAACVEQYVTTSSPGWTPRRPARQRPAAMWITILVMAVAVSLEPFRIGMTVLMLSRPRPILQLLAFLCGGFAMGTAVGLVVLFVLRPRLLGSPQFTLPNVQIVIGVLALLAAAVLATNASAAGSAAGARGRRRAGHPGDFRRRRRSFFADPQRCHAHVVPGQRLTPTPSRRIRRTSTDVT